MSENDIKNFIYELNNIETNNLIQYHNFLRDRLKAYYQEPDITESEKISLDKFDRMLNINTFLMVYSFLEGELEQVTKYNNISIDTSKVESSICRYEPLINSYNNNKLSESREWNTIRTASKIRNTLLHCGGIIEGSANQSCITQLTQSSKSGVTSVEGKLTLTAEYLSKFVLSVKSIKSIVVRLKKNK
ncbi:hypothetical protein TUM19329_36950 (plasmid) [Legionella antarctica]|uniref:MAE-28990/MAE-18760-like HEPN domain-containing protein n=1 Tax=Legionella antarctica TaxID=2708020 RepID=A0A6F8T9H8_9GAMM|nr:hypothetical protein [Legionella antarctica]BCA97334.1 hypothetical protein TUM19329_36950 [Legionella antarctica]